MQEDPIKDGYNWYAYCGNNPVIYSDPLGFFDYNTRMSIVSQNSSDDVEVLQRKLGQLGYLDLNDITVGKFDLNTEKAVSNYKIRNGLGNINADKGIVGRQTWETLGLIYRTKKDIDVGVEIVTYQGIRQYKDVTNPVRNALEVSRNVFEEHNILDAKWFAEQVGLEKKWDIKLKKSWEMTIGSTYPGSSDTIVAINGGLSTPEEIGNITYGYLGSAVGYPKAILLLGSMYPDKTWRKFNNQSALVGELNKDHGAILKGIDWV